MIARFFTLFLALVSLAACTSKPEVKQPTLIPHPAQHTPQEGAFVLESGVGVVLPTTQDDAIHQTLTQFLDHLQHVSAVELTAELPAESDPQINFQVDNSLAQEAYTITTTPTKLTVKASSGSGFFYAVQTLKQMLPVEIYANQPAPAADWSIACGEIVDQPRFSYRGMHLDVSRHFFTVEEVKRYIDMLAMYKMNRFHWHLTDDQGWRVEIKKYPRLTEVGSMRDRTMIRKEWENYDHTPHGGFYTQEELKEVVEYAADRFITVIPEIDLPGHMMAALASYPHLGCVGKGYEVSPQWGIRDDVLCVGKEETFTFVEDVLAEVMEIFPSEYIHIGGDECPKIRWEVCPRCQKRIKQLGIQGDDAHSAEHYLQSYTIERVEKFVNDKGRKIIGWDEILEGGLAPNATVMSWRGEAGGIQAAQEGHDVIMTSNSHLYFDHYQTSDTDNEPLAIGGCLPVERVYSYNPVPEKLTAEQAKHILGAQANLWTEYIHDAKQLDYMLLPRLAALAEVQWTPLEQKDYSRFERGLLHERQVYDLLGYNYGKHAYDVQANHWMVKEKRGVWVDLRVVGDFPIYYTLDGSTPTEQSPRYTETLFLDNTAQLRAMAKTDAGWTRALERDFNFNLATGILGDLTQKTYPKYTHAGAPILTDGMRGDNSYSSNRWIGTNHNPIDLELDLGQAQELKEVKVGTYVVYGDYIFPPKDITVKAMINNQWEVIGSLVLPETKEQGKDGYFEFTCPITKKVPCQKIKVVVENVDPIPQWHGARGKKGFVFVDEIVVL